MYDHIGLKVSDLASSVRFYKAALGALGFELCSQDEAGASFSGHELKRAPARELPLGRPEPVPRAVRIAKDLFR